MIEVDESRIGEMRSRARPMAVAACAADAGAVDYLALMEECRRDLREVKIGLAAWLVVEVILDYSFAIGRAAAWIPSLRVFELRTGMAKKEAGEQLAKLECYGVLDWEEARQPRFRDARLYKIFPRSARAWSIAPRVANSRLLERAASIDRWLCELNRGGGPAQREFFPPQWDHADTLAEWSAQSDDPPQARPDRLPRRSTQPPDFQPESAARLNCGRQAESAHALNSVASESGAGPPAWGKTPRVGKNPTVPINGGIELNERLVSHLSQTQTLNEAERGEKPHAEPETLDADRPESWPTREVENRLMRKLGEMFAAFYAPEVAKAEMQKYGGIWRWRVRQWPFAVEHAIEQARREWGEIRKLGGTLNKHWSGVWAKRTELRAEQLSERETEEISCEQ